MLRRNTRYGKYRKRKNNQKFSFDPYDVNDLRPTVNQARSLINNPRYQPIISPRMSQPLLKSYIEMVNPYVDQISNFPSLVKTFSINFQTEFKDARLDSLNPYWYLDYRLVIDQIKEQSPSSVRGLYVTSLDFFTNNENFNRGWMTYNIDIFGTPTASSSSTAIFQISSAQLPGIYQYDAIPQYNYYSYSPVTYRKIFYGSEQPENIRYQYSYPQNRNNYNSQFDYNTGRLLIQFVQKQSILLSYEDAHVLPGFDTLTEYVDGIVGPFQGGPTQERLLPYLSAEFDKNGNVVKGTSCRFVPVDNFEHDAHDHSLHLSLNGFFIYYNKLEL